MIVLNCYKYLLHWRSVITSCLNIIYGIVVIIENALTPKYKR